MWRLHEITVQQAAHQHELALLRRLWQRLKETRCVEKLRLFEKSSSKYTAVPFCKFSYMLYVSREEDNLQLQIQQFMKGVRVLILLSDKH